MFGEAKKIHLIEAILKIDNDAELAEIESAINKSVEVNKNKSFKDFAGIWSHEEADEMKKIIENSCEQINADDWK
jgi:hypothetical protein